MRIPSFHTVLWENYDILLKSNGHFYHYIGHADFTDSQFTSLSYKMISLGERRDQMCQIVSKMFNAALSFNTVIEIQHYPIKTTLDLSTSCWGWRIFISGWAAPLKKHIARPSPVASLQLCICECSERREWAVSSVEAGCQRMMGCSRLGLGTGMNRAAVLWPAGKFCKGSSSSTGSAQEQRIDCFISSVYWRDRFILCFFTFPPFSLTLFDPLLWTDFSRRHLRTCARTHFSLLFITHWAKSL